MGLNGHIENFIWIHGVGGDRLPAVFYALFSNAIFRLFSVHERPNVFSQTPINSKRPPHITGSLVNSVSLGWVGGHNEHAPVRVRDAVIDFVDLCLMRSRIADQGVGFP